MKNAIAQKASQKTAWQQRRDKTACVLRVHCKNAFWQQLSAVFNLETSFLCVCAQKEQRRRSLQKKENIPI